MAFSPRKRDIYMATVMRQKDAVTGSQILLVLVLSGTETILRSQADGLCEVIMLMATMIRQKEAVNGS